MHRISLSEFRARTAAMIDLVEQGETVRILRHGKPVADLAPVNDPAAPAKLPAWKRAIEPLRHQRPDGKSLAQRIVEERESARSGGPRGEAGV